jgi:hypothetical protein
MTLRKIYAAGAGTRTQCYIDPIGQVVAGCPHHRCHTSYGQSNVVQDYQEKRFSVGVDQ